MVTRIIGQFMNDGDMRHNSCGGGGGKKKMALKTFIFIFISRAKSGVDFGLGKNKPSESIEEDFI